MTTSFEGMPHKQMIAWLDQANSEAVQAVAERLASAATEIDKIGEELKIRPQTVDWKGEGANSFRTWGADLANATLRLGVYSKGVSEQLSEAAAAISLAKAATPRPQGDPEASLNAALSAPNDPDSAGLVRKLTEEREVAAMEMRKLSQTYSQSVKRMSDLERPKFPPPPQAIAPPAGEERSGGTGREFGNTPGVAGTSAYAPTNGTTGGATAGHASISGGGAGPSSVPVGHSIASRPVGMEIAGVTALPEAPSATAAIPPGAVGGKSEGGLPPAAHVVPPGVGGGRTVVSPVTGGGKSTGIARPPVTASGGGSLGADGISRPPRDGGIVGGRPVAQTSGRPVGGLPRGTVVGGEGTHAGRAPMGSGAGMGGIGGGQNGIVGGRRLAGEAGGVVGGRQQQPGQTSGRPFTPGGTGLVRGTASPGSSRGTGPAGRGGAFTPQRPGDARRDEGERPDYLVEDEETWRQGDRRVVPPVID